MLSKTTLGNNILNYLEEKEKSTNSNIFTKRFTIDTYYQINLKSKFDIPTVTTKLIKNKKIKLDISEDMLSALENSFKIIRGEISKKPKNIFPKKIEQNNDEIDDIFGCDTNKIGNIEEDLKIKKEFNLDEIEDDDILNVKSVDLNTLLKPFEKVKK